MAVAKSQFDERRKEIKVSKVYAWSELPLLLNLQQVADVLGYGRTKAWELIHTGTIRAIHVGHTLRVYREDLRSFVEGPVPEGQSQESAS